MQELSSTRASQIICTGVTIMVLGGAILGIGYILGYGKHHLTSLFGEGAAFWAGIPAVFAGVVGIVTGVYKKRDLVKLFLMFSITCLVLGILLAAIVGLMLKDWRTKGDCSYTFCPFDEVSILLILLVTILVLLAILSLTGILEAGIPLANTDDEVGNINLYQQNMEGSRNGHARRMVGYDVRPNRGQVHVQTTV